MEDATAELTRDSWAASKQGRSGVDTNWVKRFNSSTLNALVKQAMERNLDLKIASSRVQQASSAVRAADGAGRPRLDLNLNGARSKRNFIGFPFGGGAAGGAGAPGAASPGEEQVLSNLSNSFGLSLDVKWELDVWGRMRAGTSAAFAAKEAAEADYRAARASLAAQVAKSWFALLEAGQQKALADDALKIAQDTEQALQDRFKAGQASDQGGLGAQLRLARSDVASARAACAQREEIRGMLARQLEILLGSYPEGNRHAGDALPTLPQSPPAGIPAEVLQRRPDLLAAERRFAAQNMRIKEARRALFPRLALTGSAGTSTEDLNQILNSDFGVWSLAGNAVQTILAGGQVRAEIEKRSAQQDEALAALQKSVLQAFGEVENALEADAILRRRSEALAEAVRLAEEADTEARADFRNGLGDILIVFTTQSRAVQAKSALLSLRRQRLDNRVNLHLALGGDF